MCENEEHEDERTDVGASDDMPYDLNGWEDVEDGADDWDPEEPDTNEGWQ